MKSSNLNSLKFISFEWGLAKHSKSCSTFSFTHWLSRTYSVVILYFKTLSTKQYTLLQMHAFLMKRSNSSCFCSAYMLSETLLKHRSTLLNRLVRNGAWLFITRAVDELVMLDGSDPHYLRARMGVFSWGCSRSHPHPPPWSLAANSRQFSPVLDPLASADISWGKHITSG